ncbi:hypothetical protein BKA57DRAFT_450474 [Linnemannia elongata]|nr:hypothetical protein BKA57DRAFT_450474 [Linnemannia elongata]
MDWRKEGKFTFWMLLLMLFFFLLLLFVCPFLFLFFHFSLRKPKFLLLTLSPRPGSSRHVRLFVCFVWTSFAFAMSSKSY